MRPVSSFGAARMADLERARKADESNLDEIKTLLDIFSHGLWPGRIQHLLRRGV